MPKINVAAVPQLSGCGYPAPFDRPCAPRAWKSLGDAAGLTQFGVNLCTLPPGAWSSQRHWHELEDEFVHVLTGELVLVTDAGEEILRPGDCAAFKAGVADGHCLRNQGDRVATFLAIGTRDAADNGGYSDIDLRFTPTGFTRKDGTPY